MPHCINAFLGNNERINALSELWVKGRSIQLSQGMSMLFLTDELFDDITELASIDDDVTVDGFQYLTSAIIEVLEKHSHLSKLAYFETEYFGGRGSQVAILYENGKQKFPAIFTNDITDWEVDEERAINKVLKDFNVHVLNGMDEFDSIGLGNFRKMN